MDWTKFTLGTLIGGIAYFFLGWLIYGILLHDMLSIPADMAEVVSYPPEEFKISFMIISCLVWGAFLTLILLRWAGISTFMGGLKAGAIMGALISLSVGFGMASQFKFGSVNNILIDMVGNAICTGLAAGLIGWYLGRK